MICVIVGIRVSVKQNEIEWESQCVKEQHFNRLCGFFFLNNLPRMARATLIGHSEHACVCHLYCCYNDLVVFPIFNALFSVITVLLVCVLWQQRQEQQLFESMCVFTRICGPTLASVHFTLYIWDNQWNFVANSNENRNEKKKFRRNSNDSNIHEIALINIAPLRNISSQNDHHHHLKSRNAFSVIYCSCSTLLESI